MKNKGWNENGDENRDKEKNGNKNKMEIWIKWT